MKKIINITNHVLSPEQTAGFDAVVEMPSDIKKAWGQIGSTEKDVYLVVTLILDWLSKEGIEEAHIAVQGHFGATYKLVAALVDRMDCYPVYAASVRESVEEKQPDGSILKKAVFRHLSWNQY